MLINKKLNGLIFVATLLIFYSCEESVDSSQENGSVNTLGNSSVGDGTEGAIADYFYNFDYDLDVEYYRFFGADLDFSFHNYLAFYNAEPPILILKTFPQFLVEIEPGDGEFTKRTLLNALTVLDSMILDSVTLYSEPFRNIRSLEWDLIAEPEFQRYKQVTSDPVLADTTIQYNDTLNVYTYAAVVDTPLIENGLMFVDSSEWQYTTYSYETLIPTQFSHNFSFRRHQLSGDSLIFRINTDCNDDGIWTAAELIVASDTPGASYDLTEQVWFMDVGNGIWDPDEPFYDIDSDGTYDISEPFQDRNCNGIWDAGETLDDSLTSGTIKDDVLGVWFLDSGNGKYDDNEIYSDLNHNNAGDPGEIFVLDINPNKLIVTWTDRYNSQVLPVIQAAHGGQHADSIVTRWGRVYKEIIEEVDYVDAKAAQVPMLDSMVTLRTNEVVAHVTDGVATSDYLVTKTEWGISQNSYDYLLFKNAEHIFQVVQPSYFKPYGYYWNENAINDGFWYQNFFLDEILYYTSNGLLRDGEYVEESYYDTTDVAVYHIEKSYSVASDTIVVPARLKRGYEDETGDVVCYADTTWSAGSIDECPGADTTFTDCFMITRVLTMTMIGTGVEYGERNTTWLARDFGIIKDQVAIRWSELEGTSEAWSEYSRWELGRFRSSPSAGSGMFKQLLNQARMIRLNEFDKIAEFDNDPFQYRHRAGVQRVQLSND